MQTWSAIMVCILHVDGPHVCILQMADETNAEKALAVDIHDICMLRITTHIVSMCSIK